MKYSPSTSFGFHFLLYFSVALLILGIGQSIIGTLRLYNSSEEEYEKLSPDKIYTIPENKPTILPEKTVTQDISENVVYYVAEKKNSSPDILQKKPLENTKKIEQPVKKDSIRKKITSPVVISINPDKTSAPQGYRETIWTVVTGKYFRDALWNFPIIIDTERLEPRGQMYNESITLSSSILSLPEVSKVLVHEIGHMIDIYAFKKSLKKSDLSEEFYTISWKDPTTIKAGTSSLSFISGYASTNQYEDFAESFTMYIFHNKEFLKRAENNTYLKEKYTFLKTKVFGDAFLLSNYEKDPIPKKVWDVTKIGIKGNNIDSIFAWIYKVQSYKS